MHNQRHTEANILGYRLDRIEADHPEKTHYEVTCPENGNIIARFRDRPAAERFIVTRELRHISVRPSNPAY
ncbi:MAG: hypothetical protein ABI127_06730 [Dokdonella sp.]